MDLHVQCTGRGRPLVLIHGWAMHGGIFAPLVERLAGCFEVHRVDLPGHGHSRDSTMALDPPALATALAERLPRAPWLGWSLGGLVAMHGALAHADQVPGLLALAASPRFVAGDDWPHGVDPAVFHEFGAGLSTRFEATVDRFLALEAQGSDHMREELRTLRAQLHARGEPRAQALAQGLALLESSDLRSRLPALTVPSLWIAGRRDRLVPWQAMQSASATCPGGDFVRIESGAHAPFLTHADDVATAITGFIDTLPE